MGEALKCPKVPVNLLLLQMTTAIWQSGTQIRYLF